MAARQIILYGSGLFGRNLPTANAEQRAAVRDSGFTTVILSALQVEADGTLLFEDAVIGSGGVFANTFNYLPELIHGLTQGGSVTRVLLGLNAAGDLLASPDRAAMVRRNLSALTAALPIAGYDLAIAPRPTSRPCGPRRSSGSTITTSSAGPGNRFSGGTCKITRPGLATTPPLGSTGSTPT
jgi:hypothetical protein